MTLTQALVIISVVSALATVAVYLIRAIWPTPILTATDQDARALAQRAILELCVMREELAKLRADTARDRDETRDEVVKQGRAIVGAGQKAEDALRETSKLNMLMSQGPRRV